MHPFFAPLDEREKALLLTTLTVGGSDHVPLFDHMSPERAARLRDKAQALGNISGDRRVQLMVRELKNSIASNGLRGVERVDPSWIVHHLRGESPRVVGMILLGLPEPVVRSVLKRLPAAIRRKLPARESLQGVDPELSRGIRIAFESRFHPMPRASGESFRLADVIHLERGDLVTLMRDLGLVELGQAFVSVGRMALLELCRRLPRGKTEELVGAVKAASRIDLPDQKRAQLFLSRVVDNFTDTEELFQKAGLWRLARAMLGEDVALHNAFMQRLPRGPGLLYREHIDRARELPEYPEDALERLQDSVLLRIRQLSLDGRINGRWGQAEMAFHDPQAPLQANPPSEAAGAMPIRAQAQAGNDPGKNNPPATPPVQ